MADTKISGLPEKTTFSGADFAVIVDNSTVPPTSKKILLSRFPSGGGTTPFTASIAVSYTTSSLPFYAPSNAITANWTITASNTPTAIAGTISDGAITAPVTTLTGTTAPLNGAGLTIGGTVSGTGTDAIPRVINLTGSVPPISSFIPAFYAQTATSTPPTFTTTSSQTARAAQGSSITYPIASATTQYNWIATERPLANILLVNAFGNAPLVPDVTAPNQVIGGQTFSVYGFTSLAIGSAAQLLIT